MTIIYLMQWLGPNQQHFQSMYLSNVVIIKLTVSENYLITFHNQANENEHVTCMLTVKTMLYVLFCFQLQIPTKSKEKKEKKTMSTKTFAHGMMDVSLLTGNATQLRAVLANPAHDFYMLLIWFIVTSVILQIISSILLIMSDFFKTQVKEKDRQNQRKRKMLNFISLAMVTITTALNILISAFYSPVSAQQTVVTNIVKEVPVFSPGDIIGSTNHTEL